MPHRHEFVLNDGLHERIYIFLDETKGGGTGGSRSLLMGGLAIDGAADLVLDRARKVAKSQIYHVRRALGPAAHRLQSVRGVGYRLVGESHGT